MKEEDDTVYSMHVEIVEREKEREGEREREVEYTGSSAWHGTSRVLLRAPAFVIKSRGGEIRLFYSSDCVHPSDDANE